MKNKMENPPNIILINCDDLGYGDLGCYGSTINASPHVDALAAGGTRLTDFYSASLVCSASRAALMTGCYPPKVGFGRRPVLFPGENTGLSCDETTVAKIFKKAGYATQIIEKWHCGDQPEFLPTVHGFDHYFGIPFSNDMGRQVNNKGKLNERPPLPLLRDQTVIQEQPDQRGITERYTDEALQFIGANRDQPFFLYLAHMYVHVPLFVPKQFLDVSENGAYGGAVAAIDWSTGAIVDRLKQLGLFENTIIVFTSDNGSRARGEGGSNDPLRGHKAQTWEGGQRVPCIMHWPERIPADATYSGVTRNFDLLPTLAELAGVDGTTHYPIDGKSFSKNLSQNAVPVHNESFAYFSGDNLEAVRVGKWKLHFHKKDEGAVHALYDLENDVVEQENLLGQNPEAVSELSAFADQIRTELGDSLSEKEGAAIRSSGYKEDARPLTEFREDCPYMIAYYDLPDMPTMAG